ncbi:MAG: choice-of-anchor V domain-containing protein [Chitinophagaceae bacterium]
MRQRFLLFLLSGSFVGLVFSSYATGPYNGGAGNHTGSAGSPANCSTGSGCHASNNPSTIATITLITPTNDTVKDGRYFPGTLYTVYIKGTNPLSSLNQFGFQASCVDAATSNVQVGGFTSSDSKISVRNTGSLQLVEHNTPLAAITVGSGNVYEAAFNWLSPAPGKGKVRFYLTLNAVNGNGLSSGDQPNTATPVDFDEASTGISNIKMVHAEIFPNPTSSKISVRIKDAIATSASIQIVNLNGQLVRSEAVTLKNGLVDFNVANLLPGAYFLQLLNGNQSAVASFMKQ